MLRVGQVIVGGNEMLGPADPAAFAAIAGPSELATGRPTIRHRIIVIAPGDAVGVNQMVRSGGSGGMGGGDRLGADHPINDDNYPHIPDQALQNAHGIDAGIDIHVKNRRLQDRGKVRDTWRIKIMIDKDINSLRSCQGAHIGCSHTPIPGQVKPQTAQSAQGDAVVRVWWNGTEIKPGETVGGGVNVEGK